MYTLKVSIFGFVYHFSPVPGEVSDVFYILGYTCTMNELQPMGRSTRQQMTVVTWVMGWLYFNVSSSRTHLGDTFTSQS